MRLDLLNAPVSLKLYRANDTASQFQSRMLFDNFSMGLRAPCFDEGATWSIFETKKCVEPRHSQNRCTISSNTLFIQLSISIHSNCCTSQDTAFDAQRFAICHFWTRFPPIKLRKKKDSNIPLASLATLLARQLMPRKRRHASSMM